MDHPAEADRGRDDLPPDVFSIRIAVTTESLVELLGRVDLDVGDRPLVEAGPEGTGTLLAFAPAGQIAELESSGYRVETVANLSELGRSRQAEVGQGDRFEGGRVAPRGLGAKPGRDDGEGRAG